MIDRTTVERCAEVVDRIVAKQRVRLADDPPIKDTIRTAVIAALTSTATAIRALPSSGGWQVPDGYKLVPVEPTPEMNGAGDLALATNEIADCLKNYTALPVAKIYRAMLEASPDLLRVGGK